MEESTLEWKLLARSLEESRGEVSKLREKLYNHGSMGGFVEIVKVLRDLGVIYDEQWNVFEVNGVQFKASVSYPFINRSMHLSRREIEYVLIGMGWRKCMSKLEHRGSFEDPKNPGELHKLREAYAVEMGRTDHAELVEMGKRLGKTEHVMKQLKSSGVAIDDEALKAYLEQNVPAAEDE